MQTTTPAPVVLVAEPQALPGLWLEDVLADAGCTVSGPYGTCTEALASLDAAPPAFAVVSTDLNRGSGFPLACALRRRGIPFALIAGPAPIPRAFVDVPRLDRLFGAAEMIGTVAAGHAGPGERRGRWTCPMADRLSAGGALALDQCPTACRA
ncbi:histidine kinase [Methylobacterium currus]|uniref:Histidine kinase n=1 Tax=Methylobacterium currus TaxID=2051553 RepID=A0A2R4WNH3_9HYPH|nr:histidine kinase [Methylobacterium currus]AWB23083.1 histidine kinase [Methylobacterium currus]UHC17112.1 histidine kinase [Methylobacterium currus]